jgi:glycosyltransferase involved in cell wall biosynthesis
MLDFYCRARMVVMPSMIPESFGLVGIEAMACGRPVIAFDSGGISDWLMDGETGLLVERGNIEKLADSIELMFVDDGLVGSMGERARQCVDQLYRPGTHLARLDQLYRAVADAGAKSQSR